MTPLSKAGAALVLLGLLLSGCGSSGSTAEPTPTPTVMAKADAAARYLSIICPVNAANTTWTAVSSELKAEDAQAGDPVPDKLRTAVGALGAAQTAAAAQLKDPLYIWPTNAQKSINEVASEYTTNGKIYSSFAEPGATFAADPGLKVSGKAATAARSALGLPPPGKGCPSPTPTS